MLTCTPTRTGINEFETVLTLQLFQQMVLQILQAVCSNSELEDGDQNTLWQRPPDVKRSIRKKNNCRNLQLEIEPVQVKELQLLSDAFDE